VAGLVKRVEVGTGRITDEGEEGGSATSTFFLGYIVGFLVYLMILLYGMNVLRSVLEEKTNKISEVIVSSMKASHLMLGKILGVGAVALLQVAVWGAMIGFAVSRSDTLTAHFGMPPGALDVVNVPLGTLLAVLGFFVLGFLLYAALYAALGAAVNSEQEAQQFQMIVMMPLIVPMALVVRIVSDPLGQVATVLGLIPFTAPVTMAMRLASAPVPAGQIVASLALMVATVLAVAWVAGKIYRVGILSTGKRPTLRELGQWLRMAHSARGAPFSLFFAATMRVSWSRPSWAKPPASPARTAPHRRSRWSSSSRPQGRVPARRVASRGRTGWRHPLRGRSTGSQRPSPRGQRRRRAALTGFTGWRSRPACWRRSR
jgi:ABC-2 type transport system permease protein